MRALAMTSSDDSLLQIQTLASEDETAALGLRIAEELRAGDVVALSGPLGAGKTALARAIIRAFLADEDVPSPTFTLVQTYDAPSFPIWHVDLYRVKAKSELRELGLDEALETGALIIEWPDRMGEMLPSDRLDVMLETGDEPHERVAKIVARGSWVARLEKLK